MTLALVGDVLLLTDWLDWETRPSSPSAIRLISFGKLLDDKSPLSGKFLIGRS